MSYATEQGVLNAQWNAASETQNTERARRAPHVLMRPHVFHDGNQWCALYGKSLQDGVAGFGNTPEAACYDFDSNWQVQTLPRPTRRAVPCGGKQDGE